MAHPARTASRSKRRSQPRGQSGRGRQAWHRAAVRPVAMAVWLSLAGGGGAAFAGPMNPLSTTLGRSPFSIPVPVVSFTNADGSKRNIASYGEGKGTVTVQNQGKANESINLQIDQSTNRAIYQWQSFDIGERASVAYLLPSADSSALNRVSNSASASQIFGSLSSYYKDGNGKLVTGGEIYLINRNGILFGKGAQVNVGGLFVSALDMSDEDYKSGLKSISSINPTFFKWVDNGIATYDPETNYVKVEAGAEINTSSGGRVVLVGGKVENAGNIKADNGQVALAAGSDVYLNTPSSANSPLYMSEANENVPAVKGLLVEVNSARKTGEGAINTGSISTPLGNTTIVGWAVNQNGRISATTGVGQNGSVFLQARTGVSARTKDGTVNKQATQGGQLTLGQGSSIEIKPDSAKTTVAANTPFTASRIELSGKTIDIQANASIKAPGAVVNVRAEGVPSYEQKDLTEAGASLDNLGRITMAAGSSINVSGTKDTTVSVARNYVTTALLGANDIKDAPIQKTGPIYRSTLTFDIRQGSPILGDTSAYVNGVQKTANEIMSAGGKVTLAATGAVVTASTAKLDVSGGAVNYTSALVNPSVLLGQNGQRYTLNNAPVDQVYVGVAGHGAMTPTRFGNVTAPSLAGMAHMEEGYAQGSNGGALNVVAPTVVLDAQFKGGTVLGRRQAAGLDALAAASKLMLGSIDNGTKKDSAIFGTSRFASAVLGNVTVSKESQSLSDVYGSTLPDKSRVSAKQLNDSGFGSVTIATDGNIEVQDGADLNVPTQGSLTMRAAGTGGIDLGGNISGAGATVSIQTLARTPAEAQSGKNPSGTLTLREGKSIDVAGNWVNQVQDGGQVAGAVAGGQVTLSSGHALVLGKNSVIDVSGGATLGTAGAVKGSDAGAIALISNAEWNGDTPASNIKAFDMGATLRGYGVSKGGSLSMRAGSIELVDSTGTAAELTHGSAPGSLVIGKDFLTRGGFQNYSLEGVNSLNVAAGTTLNPTLSNWSATAASRNVASGSKLSQAMQVARLLDGQRAATNLALLATGSSEKLGGSLTVGQGARIVGEAGSKLSLQAGSMLEMNGSLQAPGGQISVTLGSRGAANDGQPKLHLGAQSNLDASGTVVYQPISGLQKQGKVLDGGTVIVGVGTSQNAKSSSAQIDPGAVIKADGSTGELDVARALGSAGPAFTRQTVASNGGDIQLNVGSLGGVMQGTVSAKAGNATASGGSFALRMVDAGVIHLQDGAPGATSGRGEITVSTKMLQNSGVADVSMSAPQEINFAGSLNWAVPRHLTLSSPTVSTTGSAVVNVSAGSTLRMGKEAQQGVTVTKLASNGAEQGILNLQSGLVGLFGQQALKGVKALDVKAIAEVRLMGVNESDAALSGNMPGGLLTHADVSLHAPQVTVASASKYTLDASGATVTIDGGDASAAKPLSAGGQLTINAATIRQNGVLRAPFGSITLNATKELSLGEGETSVSGQDLVVPFGSTTGGGANLVYQTNGAVTAPVEKAVVLNANGQSVNIDSKAVVDLSGGGAMVAYEFVPGPGGSKDVFEGAINGAFAVVPAVKGYAPTDAAILNKPKDVSIAPDVLLSQASGKGNTLALGNTITFGDNGVLPAGTYAILPARYALLQGAYLVKPVSGSGAVGLNYSRSQTDGSAIVGAVLGTQGVQAGNAQPTGFVVMTSDTARRYSEIKTTNLDSYFADKAETAGVAAPRLAADAGRLAIAASQASLNGAIKFAHDKSALGGQLDLASANIHVGAGKADGALNISYDQINKTGADSVVLGGVRQAVSSDGTAALNVSAASVVVDAEQDEQGKARSLKVGDLTLAATGAVTVKDGVQIEAASTSSKAGALNVKGNGALLRVSGDSTASTTRNLDGVTQVGATGDLSIGQKASIKGGAIVAEGTRSNTIASGDATGATMSAAKLVIGARRMVAGEVPTGINVNDGSTLVLSDPLLNQFNQAQALTLRSFGGLDMYQGASVGGAATRSLAIDTANIRVKGETTAANIRAGGVQLLNTTGVAVDASSYDLGTLTVTANGQAGGTGHITLGGGNIAIAGSAVTQLNAAGSVVLAGNGGVSTPGDLRMAAVSLTAQQGAASNLQSSGGWIKLEAPAAGVATMAAATPGAGAQVTVSAATIDQLGKIALPSGVLNLGARYQLRFGANSTTDLSGLNKTIDGVALDSLGGTLTASSKLADVTQLAGALIDVSAGSGGGKAGSMNFSATQGSVKLQGRLLAHSSNQQSGASLVIDSGKAVDLDALSRTIAADQTATQKNFAEAISVRTRLKSQNLSLAAGSKLDAQSLDLSSDLGDVTLKGALHATSQTGGHITVSAGGNVVVQDTADLQAHADAGGKNVQTTGGLVTLMSSGLTRADGSLGTVKLLGGTVDTSGKNGGQDGRVNVRATSAALLADNSAVGTTLTGVRSLGVEAVKVIQASLDTTTGASTVTDDTISQATAYVADLQDNTGGGSKAERIANRMAGGSAVLLDKTQVRAGVEIQSPNDLTLDTDLNLVSWRTGADSVSDPLPVNLTLRAGGNLFIKSSISDGFLGDDTAVVARTDLIKAGQAGSLRLIGGADLKGANVMATKVVGSNGDVVIGRYDPSGPNNKLVPADVLVRTTTGDIQIAAARDVTLSNPKAAVYTTGLLVPMAEDYSLQDPGGDYPATLFGDLGPLSPFMTGGGSVSVTAGRDVTALPDFNQSGKNPAQQYITDWWWRSKGEFDNALAWWSRYDLFQQGFATFGGGNVSAAAGRDAWNVSVSAAGSGYQNADASHGTFGGGSVALQAGRDIVGGSTFASDKTQVFAGHSITDQTALDNGLVQSRANAPSNLVVAYGNGSTNVMARGSATVAALMQPGLSSMAFDPLGAGQANFALFGLTPDASLNVSSVSGNLTYTGEVVNGYQYASGVDNERTVVTNKALAPALLPASTTLQAGLGDASMGGDLFQLAAVRQDSDGNNVRQELRLSVLAGGNLNIKGLTQYGSDAVAAKPSFIKAPKQGWAEFPTVKLSDSKAFYASSLVGGGADEQVRLVAQGGDVAYGVLYVKQPLRLIAGRDISTTQGGIRIQSQDANAISLIQAGRDVDLEHGTGFGIEVQGPGDAVFVVGRSMDLHETQGIKATGNRRNPELPAGSANITILTGASFAKGDVLNASNAYFELLGGAGVGDFAPDLYAQLTALSSSQSLPTLGSDAAKAFATLSVDDQLSRARAIVGDTAFQQRVLTFMQHRENPTLTQSQALDQFNSLAAVDKASLVGLLLGSAWSSKLPQADQLNAVMAMAASRNNPYTDKLVSFMQQRTGQVLSPIEADKQFKALNPEEQLLFSSKVLVGEMNAAVSKAAALTGAAKNAAYINAYNALDTMFPSASVKHADLQMGASTIQTQQNSEINVFAPSGGVNVGQLTASSTSKDAKDLGMMTAGGGNLAIAARDDILVNQSRVFTVGDGDELIWSSTANVDAGRGGKTVTAVASPVYYLDNNGQLQVDVTSAISGSGIKASGIARVAAPKGEINAGDAGISAGKGLELAATFVRGADNIQAPSITGAPPPTAVNPATAVNTPTQPTAAGTKDASEDGGGPSKKRKKRNILLDFLGFGSGSDDTNNN